MAAGLVLGAVDLMGAGYNIYALGTDSGTNWGNPAPVEVQLQSFLQDGAVVVTQSYENREQYIAVEITGANLTAVAAAEAALFQELGERNTLTYTPPGSSPVSTVWDVVTSSLEPLPDDLVETMQGRRNYLIRLVSLPWARSTTEVSVAALGTGAALPAPTVTVIDDCTATTGWARGGDATTGPTVVTGAVTVGLGTASGGNATLTATRTGLSVNMATTPYLLVTVSQAANPFFQTAGITSFVVNGVARPVVAQSGGVYVVDCTGLTITSIAISGYWTKINPGPTGTATLRVDDISRSDQPVVVGTTRQLQRTISLQGSAPTQATLALEHTTSALGDVIVYAYKNDNPFYSPPLRQYRAGGTASTTPDSSVVSGTTELLQTSPQTPAFFDIPVSALPLGAYEILGRFSTTSVGSYPLTYTVQTRVNGVNVGPAQTGTVNQSLQTSTYNIVSLGVCNLRAVKVPLNSTAVVRISIGSFLQVIFDEGWVFNLDIGSLTRTSCGTAAPSAGGPSNRLFLVPPTLANAGLPSLLRGFAADQSDSFFPSQVDAWTPPTFKPPSVGLFTVTTNALNAAASARYYPRWHTNAAS